MWKNFYHKIVEEKETKEKEQKERTDHELRIQEIDGGFFENLGTLLVEKVRAQEQIEGPLPKKKEETGGEDEDSFTEVESIEEPTEALLETDSDRDEKEHAHNFLIDSVGLNTFR